MRLRQKTRPREAGVPSRLTTVTPVRYISRPPRKSNAEPKAKIVTKYNVNKLQPIAINREMRVDINSEVNAAVANPTVSSEETGIAMYQH